ncbi:MAG: hypothetical protein ABFD89_05270 [Bryobacteraceae bacterium]
MKDPTFRPTCGLDGAKHVLDLNEDYILDLIAGKQIRFAWNIGLGKDRREIRILRASIDHYMAHGSKPDGLTEDAVFALLLPPGFQSKLDPRHPDRTYLTNGEIQRSLNCVSDHVLHLVESGDLALEPKTDYGRGPNNAARITVVSFKAFLQSRRLK